MITLSKINDAVAYNDKTGEFTRKTVRNGSPVGSIVGKMSDYNNLMPHIVINGAQYSQPFLAYFICNGFEPEGKAVRINSDIMPKIDNIKVVSRASKYMKYPEAVIQSSVYFKSPCNREAVILDRSGEQIRVASRFSPICDYGNSVWVDKGKFYSYYDPV